MAEVLHKFLGPNCTATFIERGELLDPTCIKFVFTQILSYSLVVASLGLKLPQILQIVRAKSGKGISVMMYQLEITVFALSVAYFMLKGYPFSTFGDIMFILIQDLVLYTLLFYYENELNAKFFLSAGIFGAVFAFLLSGHAPLDQLYPLTIPIGIASRVPQIVKNVREGGVGNLNATTFSMNALGALARVFTTLQLVKDPMVLIGYVVSVLLNGTIVGQIVYYNYIRKSNNKDNVQTTPNAAAGAGAASTTTTTTTTSAAASKRKPKKE